MSRFYCDDDYEHRRDAERDARSGHRDYEMYDRYSDDGCKRAYVDAYDCERDRMSHEREQREAEDSRQRSQAREQRDWEEYQEEAEQYYYALLQEAEEFPEGFPEHNTSQTGDETP